MSKEIILKKLEQIKELLGELERLLTSPITDFKNNLTAIRAAERNFELAVELSSDINTQILFELGKKTPDSYRESFSSLSKAGVIEDKLAEKLMQSARLRNILVHEYDFEEDYEKFYRSAKEYIPVFREYTETIYKYKTEENLSQ